MSEVSTVPLEHPPRSLRRRRPLVRPVARPAEPSRRLDRGPVPRRWTREEYYRMGEAGILAPDERVELIQGEIWVLAPQGSSHSSASGRTEDVLRRTFGPGHTFRVQMPLSLGLDSDPEPDVAVVPGTWDDYDDAHPTSARLVVEASDTTLNHDRTVKASLYAAAGVEDYWIINLVDRRVEVYRNPQPDETAPAGFRYGRVSYHERGEVITPLAAPQSPVRVDDLLPRSCPAAAAACQ